MLGAASFLICILALLVGMEVRSPGTLQTATEAAILTWSVANQHVAADICAKLDTMGRPLVACTAG